MPQNAGNLPFRHDGNAVADGAQLLQFGGNDDNRHLLFAVEVYERFQYKLLGADINAACRL